jgi:hypothetical protein
LDDPDSLRTAAQYIESNGTVLAAERDWVAAGFLNKVKVKGAA